MKVPAVKIVPRRGRPRKFAGPSRAVTLTLPETALAALASMDDDLSRAIVRLTQSALAKRTHKAAELSTFGRHAVIVVRPTPTLKERTGVHLVPLPDGRALISFAQPTTIEGLELMIDDALEDSGLSRDDRAVFAAIGDILRTARRSNDVTLLQRSIIVLQASRPQPQSNGRKPRRARRRTS